MAGRLAPLYRFLKKPFFGRYQKPWKWPSSVERNDWRTITFGNVSRARLSGLCGSAKGPIVRGSIVCAHPMGIDAKGFFLKRGHADMLRTRGYNVLLFDFNGFGESEEGGFSYPDDLVSAARAAQAEWPGARVGVLGLSFGAGWAICALSRPDPGFQVLVAECPFTTLDEFWIRHRGAYLALQVFNRIMPGIAANLRPIAHIGAARTPMRLMLVYGSHDDVTPPSMGARFVEACTLPASSVEMWISPVGEHTKILPADPGLYEERVVGFFDRAFGHAAASPA